MKVLRTRTSGSSPQNPFVPRPVIIVVCALIVAVAGAYAVSIVRFNRVSIIRHLEAVSSQKAFELSRWRAERLDDALVFGPSRDGGSVRSTIDAIHQDSGAHPYLRAFVRSAVEGGVYDRVLWYDGEGRFIAAYPERDADDPRLSEAVRSGRYSDGPGFVDFYDDEGTSSPRFALVVPIGKGVDSWFVALRIDPRNYLYPQLALWPANFDSAETLLVRREGGELVVLNAARRGEHPPLSLRMRIPADGDLPVAKAVAGEASPFIRKDYRGKTAIAYTTRVEGSPWALVSKIDLREADAFVLPQLAMLGLTVALAIATVVAGSVAASRSARLASMRREASLTDALVVSEEKYRLLHESMRECFAQADMDGRIVLTNEPFRELVGFGEEELLAMSSADLTPESWWELDREIVGEVLDRGYSRVYRKELLRKGGSTVPVELRVFLLRDSNGVPVGMWGIVRDVSERDRGERLLRARSEELERRVRERTAQLEASNKRLKEFAYTVAHDLRAPLRSIDGFARILEEEYGPSLDHEGRRIIEVIRRSDERMDGLIRDILSVSSLASAELKPVKLDMKELALEMFRSCADPDTLAGFELVVGDLPEVEADASMMARVWTNLLSNAVKFSRDSAVKRIELSGAVVGRMAEYAVRDHGIGFDPEYAERLFGMFQRLHPAAAYPGSGMGLAIVKQVVELHGGSVRAESAPGQGAAFAFSLPVGNAR